MRLLLLLTSLFLFLTGSSVVADDPTAPVYELRTYYPNEGKLEALNQRFRDHTIALFEKHGMTNIGYWTPTSGDSLIYLLRYPSREARAASWKAFLADADWKKAYAASTEDGKLVAKIDNLFLQTTDFSPLPELKAGDKERLFEIRTYTTNEDKLETLHSRFRDHTVGLFEKHGLANLWYFQPMKDQKNASTTLIYLLAHENEEKRNAGFKAFGADPAWKSAKEASVKGGPILVKKGVQYDLLKPTDYSPIR